MLIPALPAAAAENGRANQSTFKYSRVVTFFQDFNVTVD
jgi:hypothetical protein